MTVHRWGSESDLGRPPGDEVLAPELLQGLEGAARGRGGGEDAQAAGDGLASGEGMAGHP